MTAPRTILLADDSVTIRKAVELTFSDTNIRVLSVGSGHEALDRMSEVRPDLVLADVVMPGPSGYDVCRAVKSSPRPVPVLLLTGAFEPFDSRSLVERVEELLARAGRPKPKAAPAPAPPDDDLEEMFDALAEAPPASPAAAAPSPEPAPEPAPRPMPAVAGLTEGDIDAIARAVVARLSDRVLREIAWDVVPDLAEVIVRERLQELERGEREPR